MSNEAKARLVREWMAALSSPNLDKKQLSEAIYSIGELGLWPDMTDYMSVDQCVLCWSIVEEMMKHGFPGKLRM